MGPSLSDETSGSLTQDLRIDRVPRNKSPDAHFALLAVASNTTDGLRFAGDVLLGSVRQQRMHENGVVRRRQIGAGSALVSAEKEKNASVVCF